MAAPASAVDPVGQITGLAGKCVDVNAAATANGTAIQLFTCNGSAAQQWTMAADGSVRALGKCLDVAAAGTADGTRVQLWDCNGTVAQRWAFSAAHDLVNPNANKCLDVTGNVSTDRTPLQIWTCTGGANQKWTVPTGGTTTPPPGVAGMQVAPYFTVGFGSPPNPATVMNATGVRWFTMAFVLSNGTCSPQWDGGRPLLGGADASTINTIRANGGDIVPSFGGAAGNKLEQSCTSAAALAGAYQQVINAFGLRAIDIDIEGDAYNNATVQQRTVDALKTIRASNPGVAIYVTFPSAGTGPDATLINRAAASGLTVDAWTIMPFDFGGNGQDMGALSTQATDVLKNRLVTAYGYSADTAYRHSGISSMNGITDVGENISIANFRTMLAYAQLHHLARLTFWSVDRDRQCAGALSGNCSGVPQADWDFTRVFAAYRG
ncbi:MAG TPA: RICIN domain-containing protein [Mycobacteriales bacterium]|nr:RICIN domain-containing protein [Mycobacteriales bacterium]